MTTSDADAVANLERVVLEALEIMDEKISKTLAGIERKIDDAVARSVEGRGAAATKRFPKKRNANANAKVETSVGAKRAASTARTTMTSSSESSSESKPNEDETKDDSAKTRRANANANGTTTTSAKTVKTVKTMKPAVGAKKKRQKTGRTPRGATQDDLTEDEKLLIATGRGRRGEVVSTPLGYAYFTKDDDETILSVGRKIGAEPLTLYSMNRWQLELKKFKIDDVLHPGTRLWIVPNEDWEEEYIREDRAKVLSNLHARIKEVFPDFIKNTRPFVEMRPEDFSRARSSKTFYDDMKATVDAAEANARRVRDDEKLEDITTIRERFDEKWASIGFLKPDDVVSSGLGLVGLLGAREATETHGSILDPERDACASDSDGDRARRARRWCERAGGTFSSCELGAAAARDEAARDASRDGRGGVGAFARGVGGTLMTIPDAATMNARSCAGDPALGETYVELARRGALDARTATMCMLMIERRRGEASAWREYVDALPRRYDAPLSFSEEELERELKGTPAFAAAKAQRASATKMFEENIRPAVRALTQADNAAGGSLHVLPEVSEREFLWAYQTFWSRAVSIPAGRGDAVESVVPGIDFVNHGGATKTNARWEHVVDANAPGGGYVALVWSPPRRRRPTEGEEIFIDYGEKSSESLLFTYGFTVEDDRPAADVLTVLPPWIDEAPEDRSELVSAKIAALRALGAPPRLTLPATPSRRGVVDLPTDALRVLQIWTASSVDAVADVARDASSGRRPRRLSAAAVADIRDALRASLGASSHALRELEDANAGRANEENSRSRACRAYRAARRRALDRWLEHLAT